MSYRRDEWTKFPILLNTYCSWFIFQPTSRFQISLRPFPNTGWFFHCKIFYSLFPKYTNSQPIKNRMATLQYWHFPVPSFSSTSISSTGIFQYCHFPVLSFSSTGFRYRHFPVPAFSVPAFSSIDIFQYPAFSSTVIFQYLHFPVLHFPVMAFSSTVIFQYRHFPVPAFSSTGIF